MTYLPVWLHLTAAVVWIGGMLFLAIVAVPILRPRAESQVSRELFRALAQRFRLVAWLCVLVLAATGPLLLLLRYESLGPALWPGILRAKLALVGVLIVLTAMHDVWLGPRATALLNTSPADRSASERLALRFVSGIARFGLALALLILLLAVVVART